MIYVTNIIFQIIKNNKKNTPYGLISVCECCSYMIIKFFIFILRHKLIYQGFMQTIFTQNHVVVDYPFSNILSPTDLTLYNSNPFRNSLSPHKLINKKFYYSVRNKSKRQIQQVKTTKIELQNLMNKDFMIKAKKSDINSIIISECQRMFEERQLMILPSIQLKSSHHDNKMRIQAQQKKINQRELLAACDLKKKSNVLGIDMLQTVSNSNDNLCNINWKSEKIDRKNIEMYHPYHQRSKIQYPKIYNFKANPESVHNMKSVKIHDFSPQKLKQAQSLTKLAQMAQNQLKYKKGYLSYERQQNICFWNRIRPLLTQVPIMKINNSKLVSAKIYYAVDLQNLKAIVGSKESESIEIASLSKIMTCYLSILICKKYKVEMKCCTYRVPDKVPDTPGTSAELEAGDILSVEDLLYALMLPSGNDASICLAQLMGKVIQKNKKKDLKKSFYQIFLDQMNLFSKELGLPQQWKNSSGLPTNPNFSTAQAIVLLSALAIKNDLFKKIVQTKQYQIQLKNDRYGLLKKKIWRNTNKLLQKGWQGVKTGTTQTAGHCLISKNQNLLIGVFDCSTLNRRFIDCTKLYQHISSRLKDLKQLQSNQQ